ncbi:MAG TPA: glycosyltransferase family 39 protein, partial [Bryobacteraceae bacterium]|nr:glycosyltransferase family 39 protein [Bryobacteraceae bacterium]
MQNASNPATDPQPLFSSSVTASIKGQIETLTDILDSWRIPILILLSVLYFWTTAFRAETKLYWFDEICTVQVSTLRGLRPIWTALTHGADYNPPLMYLLTGFSQHLLGNTSLAARMPEIIAFWIFCLSAYVFTYRFAGASGALTAFLFPLITVAYWYSYEARAYALVLGFTGLAVLCWQQAQTSRYRLWWLIGLGFSLGFVLLSHAFGLVVFFPIAIAEIIEIRVTKRFRSGAWIAMACGGSAILASIILLRTLKTEHLSSVGSLGPWIVVSTYLFILAPAAMVLGLAICAILLPWQKILPAQAASPNEIASWNRFIGKITRAECVLLAGFLSLPIISFVVAFVNRAPLYTRYSLAAVLRFACVLGVAAIGRPAFALALPVIIAVQYIYDFGSFINHRRVYDPVTLLQIDASLTQF